MEWVGRSEFEDYLPVMAERRWGWRALRRGADGNAQEGDMDGDGALDELEFCVLMFQLSPELMAGVTFESSTGPSATSS
ncbi:unnamed protein product [Spirodela intermedia]|uniref:Uncharacterized protein n=1 Tax=Spirodela intermedia TaxID=51605 RepID=A0A7I8KBH0_SPIIN|nr:unnamed protein product [Spirodela intermedia]